MDKIVYKLVTRPGGVDGMGYTDKGGDVRAAFFDKAQAEKHPGKPWCDIVPIVVDVEKARKAALKKLNALDKLVLGLDDK